MPNAPELACAGCAAPFRFHSHPTRPGARPRAGNQTVCAYCATVHVYVDTGCGLAVRPADPDEVAVAMLEPANRAMIAAALQRRRVADVLAAGRAARDRAETTRLQAEPIVVGGRRRGYTTSRGGPRPR